VKNNAGLLTISVVNRTCNDVMCKMHNSQINVLVKTSSRERPLANEDRTLTS